MNAAVGIPLTVVLLALNAFFVGAEFALVSARRATIEPQAEAGSRRAATTLRAMEQVSLMMAGAQLGITVCSLALGAVSEPVIAHEIEPAFDAIGLPSAILHPLAFVLALLLVTVLHVVLGEMVPKNVALAGPDRAALWLAPPLAATVRALRPLIWLLNAMANGVLRLVRVTPREEVASAFTRDEVAGMVEESHREGLLDAPDRDLIGGAFAFDSATARTLTLPLSRVHTLDPEPSAADVERVAARTGVSRFPVRDGHRLTGYVHLKDTLGAPDPAAPLPPAYVRPLPRVEADATLAATVELMRTAGAHLAEVEDAGRTLGVITLDDILASLVPSAQVAPG